MGTFDQRVWTLALNGRNALLTGDIGSGKSTLVDALTALLVPPQRIVFNKAAGAETRERSMRSYVQGHYKSEQDSDNLKAKAVGLRDTSSHTVLLARFTHAGFEEGLTLAQVLWMREGQSTPERFFVVAEEDLNIAEHFHAVEGEPGKLRQRLRRDHHAEIFDSYAKYAASFRRRLGIDGEKPIDLLYQTVSMKAVGNLTDFVREHMLEDGGFHERIDEICSHFDNLNAAHEAVLKAKDQIQRLTPLVQDGQRHREESQQRQEMERQRSVLLAFFEAKRVGLLEDRLAQRHHDLDRLNHRVQQAEIKLTQAQATEADLHHQIRDNGGNRLEEIDAQIQRLSLTQKAKRRKRDEYARLVKTLSRAAVQDADGFANLRVWAEQALPELEARNEDLNKQHTDLSIKLHDRNTESQQLTDEIESLKGRDSNIPRHMLKLREDLCAALNLSPNQLPFAGELLEVREEHAAWRGAAERLLHGLGLSLLVTKDQYPAVSRYVDQTHLGRRLVYYRAQPPQQRTPITRRPGAGAQTNHMLWKKLRIKPNTACHAWLEDHLSKRFDHHCCDDLESFRRLPKAITRQGQIKAGGERHEKDDRTRIDDASRYVLGWSNADKLAALQTQRRQVDTEGRKLLDELKSIHETRQSLATRRDQIRDLYHYNDFTEMDWEFVAKAIDDLDRERQAIESSSNLSQTLRAQLEQTQQAIQIDTQKDRDLRDQRSKLENKIDTDQNAREEAIGIVNTIEPEQREQRFAQLNDLEPQALSGKPVTIENCSACQTQMREWLQQQIDNCDKRIGSLREKLARQMQAYRHRYPLETRDTDASVQALPEYEAMLESLTEQDLPRFEARFKELLQEGTIREIALLQSLLEEETHKIQTKIDRINQSLWPIDYNAGTYIRMVRDPAQDQEIRQFRTDLRACLSDTLTETENDLYTETKFLQVKALIDRFRGREGYAEIDRRWRTKVTDVRNWFNFSAIERWREDNKDREFYSDSSGKSGGQKEKLAYTILASALAYQFGIDTHRNAAAQEARSRTFRFVMIDEAFGRGSDDSAKYGLEIFRRLGLQLLVITPLQKIHVIEDYVRSVHFVQNHDGQRSQLRSMPIHVYRSAPGSSKLDHHEADRSVVADEQAPD